MSGRLIIVTVICDEPNQNVGLYEAVVVRSYPTTTTTTTTDLTTTAAGAPAPACGRPTAGTAHGLDQRRRHVQLIAVPMTAVFQGPAVRSERVLTVLYTILQFLSRDLVPRHNVSSNVTHRRTRPFYLKITPPWLCVTGRNELVPRFNHNRCTLENYVDFGVVRDNQ